MQERRRPGGPRHGAAPRRATGLAFAVLCSVPFVMVLSNSMLIPVLPQMRGAMDRSLFQIGLIITAFSVPAGLFIPIGGYLSDRWGRKPVMIPGLVGFGLGGLMAGLAPLFTRDPYGWILAGRVLQGLAAGGMYQVALAAAGDMYQGGARTRAMGIMEASNGLGKIASPILGSALALLAWYVPFFAYPALAALSALGLWLWVPEPNRRREAPAPGPYLRRIARIFRAKGVSLAVCFLAGFTALFMLFGLLSVYSDLLERPFGIRGFVKGVVVAIPVAVATVTAYLSGIVLQDRLARYLKAVVVAGIALLAAGTAALYFMRDLVPMIVAISVMGLGYGLALPAINTLITSSVETAERGGITALYGTVRFFGAALGPPAFGLLLAWGRAAMYLGSGAAVAAVLGLVAAFLRQDVLLKPLPAAGVPEPAAAADRPATAGQGARGGTGAVAWGHAGRRAAAPGDDPAAARPSAGGSLREAAGPVPPLARRAPGGGGDGRWREGGGTPVIPLGPWSRVRSSFPPRQGMSPAS
ncbi:major facilitator superfamily MFS_1 [Thermaerobacter marianensis DSM 12885]|uniref:Major facilitator superfamily MFS_1 n=1 Tax=Thermaerobacter marianensis (strain ATCC 700841 / DSM 12885 / JCM 10246 / 7p75a) TaxID=644966 RepID=E6SJB8_THEM7|nr:major facilitator superfamily MFS_1 [Thermaerobacter marianensis DSM 12885]